MQLITVAIPLLTGVVTAAVATPMVSRLALALDAVDRPNERKVNRRPDIPLLGGLSVALGFFVAISAAVLWREEITHVRGHLEGLLLGGALMLGLGVFDDRRSLSALPKLLVQLLAAGIAIAFGFRIEYVADPISGTPYWLPQWAVWTLSMLWIVGITNAINLLDGLDGLATGVGAIVAATLTIVCLQADQLLGVSIGLALVGSLLGFLPYNFSPARIFLGDTGALFIGFTLALLALEGYRQATILTFLVPLLALAVPILDTGLSVLRRARRRAGIFSADREHMHHRLLEAEGSHRAAVLALYFLTACFCVIALSFTRLQGWVSLAFLLMVLMLTIRLLRNLGLMRLRAEREAGETPAPEEH